MKISEPTPFPLKRVLSLIGAVILFLLIGGLAYSQFDEWRYRPISSFDSARWNKPDRKYRYSVTDYVIHQVVKPGMSETEIVNLLGTPNAVTANEDYQYETQHPGLRFLNWTGGGIVIKFDRDRRVIEAIDNTLVD